MEANLVEEYLDKRITLYAGNIFGKKNKVALMHVADTCTCTITIHMDK